MTKYESDENHRLAVKNRSKRKYADDEQHKTALKNRSKRKYDEDEKHRSLKKENSIRKYQENDQHRVAVKEHLIKEYHENEQQCSVVKERAKERYKYCVKQRKCISNVINEFRLKSHEAPTTICCICISHWFVGKVKRFKQSTYSERRMYSKCV